MDIGWKLVSAATGAVSGFIANKVVDLIWNGALGKTTPGNDPTEPLRDTVVFAVVSAMVGSFVNTLTTRKAAQWYGAEGLTKSKNSKNTADHALK